MLKRLFNNIRFDALVVIISLFISGTYFLDKIIWAIVSAYLRHHYDSHFIAKGSSRIDAAGIAYWSLFLQSYYLVVYHLLVLTAIILVYCHIKLKMYKREVFYAYITIAICFIGYFAADRLLAIL